MEACENRKWLIKLNKISWNVLMPVMAVTFILFNTVINQWIGERIETLQNLIVIFIMLIFVCNIFANPKKNIPEWVKGNWIVIVYFIVRLLTLVKMDFDYSTIRTIFFEVFFLIGITECTVGGSSKRNLYIKIFVWIELVMTALSLLLYYMLPYLGEGMNDFAGSMMFLEKSGNALLFSNPNTAGLMAGFAVVMAIMCYKKGIFNDKFLIIYGIYNVIALILFGCRSSDVGLILVILVLIFNRLFPRIKGRCIALTISVMMILTLVPIYGVIIANVQPGIFTLTTAEKSIDAMSSGRYVIWKQCYLVHKDDLLLGNGSLKAEQENRQNFMTETELTEEMNVDPHVHWDFVQAATFGPHNGYVGMLSCTGILGMILFFAVVIQRMRKAKSLADGKWYLMFVFIFTANCFESLFIVNRFFTCFYMLLLLTIDFNDDGSGDVPSLEETE